MDFLSRSIICEICDAARAEFIWHKEGKRIQICKTCAEEKAGRKINDEELVLKTKI